MAQESDRSTAPKSIVERLMGVLAETHAGEGTTALLLTLDVFLLLTCYYLLKTAREPLILALKGGAEVKSYSSAGQALLLIPMAHFYGVLAQKVGRIRLITIVTLFFVSNLLIFFVIGKAHVPIGIPFFLWVGVFNMMIIAQFWSFAADVYTEAQGKRLFAILGVGSTVGAVAGSGIAKALVKPFGVFGLMLAAAVFLVLSLGMTIYVDHRERRREASAKEPKKEEPVGKGGGFAMLLHDKYLFLIGALAFVINWVNSSGEYILDRTLLEKVKTLVIPAGADAAVFIQGYEGEFKARYFLFVNIATVVLQLFAVSRVIKYMGVRAALFVMPIISTLVYSSLAFVPLLGLVFVGKVVENSLDYSLENTARQALWLLTSRDAKYKAKSVIDAFIVRFGDVMSAIVVGAGTALGFATVHFVMINAVLAGGWIVVVLFLTRAHKKKSAEAATSERDPNALPA